MSISSDFAISAAKRGARVTLTPDKRHVFVEGEHCSYFIPVGEFPAELIPNPEETPCAS